MFYPATMSIHVDRLALSVVSIDLRRAFSIDEQGYDSIALRDSQCKSREHTESRK
jgi:hypothetical protein